MKRADQILKLLADHGERMSAKKIAEACDTVPQNIGSVLQDLVSDGHLSKMIGNSNVVEYIVTQAGIARTKESDFGQEGRAQRAPAVPATASLNMGVFTNGELHIEANGKKLTLTRAQAVELVEFVCALPNKLFAPPQERPTLASLPSRVIRSE